jgi:carbon starvation protein
MAMAISAFLLTTLDTATRLTRFTWQELFLPAGTDASAGSGLRTSMGNRYVATLVAVLIAGYLAMSGNAQQIWPVFGASNQLLAALTLLGVTLILIRAGKPFWVTLFPMLFMLVVCLWALCSLFVTNWRREDRNGVLIAATAFLIVMALGLAVKAAASLKGAHGNSGRMPGHGS